MTPPHHGTFMGCMGLPWDVRDNAMAPWHFHDSSVTFSWTFSIGGFHGSFMKLYWRHTWPFFFRGGRFDGSTMELS